VGCLAHLTDADRGALLKAKARQAGCKAVTARADAFAAPIAPTVAELQAGGARSLRAIARGLDERGGHAEKRVRLTAEIDELKAKRAELEAECAVEQRKLTELHGLTGLEFLKRCTTQAAAAARERERRFRKSVGRRYAPAYRRRNSGPRRRSKLLRAPLGSAPWRRVACGRSVRGGSRARLLGEPRCSSGLPRLAIGVGPAALGSAVLVMRRRPSCRRAPARPGGGWRPGATGSLFVSAATLRERSAIAHPCGPGRACQGRGHRCRAFTPCL
jgi:hypothetical protein